MASPPSISIAKPVVGRTYRGSYRAIVISGTLLGFAVGATAAAFGSSGWMGFFTGSRLWLAGSTVGVTTFLGFLTSRVCTLGIRFGRQRAVEYLVRAGLFVCASVTVLTTLVLVTTLVWHAAVFFASYPLREFFTNQWSPVGSQPAFGVVPLLTSTVWIAIGSGLVAFPLGLLAAIFLAEYARPRAQDLLQSIFEILANIPPIVYGVAAYMLVAPICNDMFAVPSANSFASAMTAVIVISVMILPTTISLGERILRNVPQELRDVGFGLGGTQLEVIATIILPAAAPKLIGVFLLACSRAIGETMVVVLATSAFATTSQHPLDSLQTLTNYLISTTSQAGPSPGSLTYQSLFAIGLLLLLISTVANLCSQWLMGEDPAQKSGPSALPEQI